MKKFWGLGLALFMGVAQPAQAKDWFDFTFTSIEGGLIETESYRGKAVLVVNTASKCGFTDQLEGMQDIYARYRERGLVVLAVPSDDFRQELDSNEEVAEFCALTYGTEFPMTEITRVKGALAHPFYKWAAAQTGFKPRWNFYKILIGPDGQIVDSWNSLTRPNSGKVMQAVEKALADK
jgi:glutathione peroxidase